MNKELSEYILSTMGKPDYIDRWCGVVQVLTDADGKKLPAGSILAGAECGLKNKPSAIIPDSSYKGILFFEDKGMTPAKNLSRCYGYRAELRLICWLNNNRIDMDESAHTLSTYAMADLTQRLLSVASVHDNNGIFLMVRPVITGVASQDGNIFNKYDFDDKTSGYLQGQFQYFAIDLAVNFYIPKTCLFTMVPGNNQCPAPQN